MSVAAISWVMDLDHSDPIEKFVLMALANFADDYGVTWVSQGRLRKCCSSSERTVRTSLKSLEEAGLIVRVPRRRDNGSRQSDVAILTGFPTRTLPANREDHEVFRLLDDVCWQKVTTSNRHHVPPVATGTTCPTPRHHVPHPPAPRAGLEPLIEPLIEPYPPTPHTFEAQRHEPTDHERHQSVQRKVTRSGPWVRPFDEALASLAQSVPSEMAEKGLVFDPLNPPSATNPLPNTGLAASMTVFQALVKARRYDHAPRLSEEQGSAVVEIETALAASVIPARPVEVRDAVLVLLSHYPARAMSYDERVSVARDWIIDLASAPADILAAACQEWRRGPNSYAPTPGHLLGMIKPVLELRRYYHRLATDWLKSSRAEVQTV